MARAVERIRAGELEKVVLAREVRVHAPRPADAGAVLGGLRGAFPACYCYLVATPEAAFVGASPELLVRRDGARAQSVALAGTTRRSADPAVDDHLGEQLLRSAKDREEQAIVARRIERTLAPVSLWVAAAEEPALIKVHNVQHLATPIRAQLREPIGTLDLAALLHPTPAVGGEPRELAAAAIPELEGLDRGWYAGALGWIDLVEDGELCVALRCALLRGSVAHLYAGDGIVRDSVAGGRARRDRGEARGSSASPHLSSLRRHPRAKSLKRDSLSVVSAAARGYRARERHEHDRRAAAEQRHATRSSFDKGDLPLPPAKKIAILTCMDARLSPYVMLGLNEGDAHVIRNAGGVVTDDEIRSLAISQRLLGTEEIMVIHHTDCGMLTFSDDDFRRQIQEDTGVKPQWAAEAFPELEEDVRQSMARIQASPFVPNKDNVRGLRLRGRVGPAARGHLTALAATRASVSRCRSTLSARSVGNSTRPGASSAARTSSGVRATVCGIPASAATSDRSMARGVATSRS